MGSAIIRLCAFVSVCSGVCISACVRVCPETRMSPCTRKDVANTHRRKGVLFGLQAQVSLELVSKR